MGKNREARAAGQSDWTVVYCGGGPWDGAVRRFPEPIQRHVLSVSNGELEGFQVYELVAQHDVCRVLDLHYAGERWGEPF